MSVQDILTDDDSSDDIVDTSLNYSTSFKPADNTWRDSILEHSSSDEDVAASKKSEESDGIVVEYSEDEEILKEIDHDLTIYQTEVSDDEGAAALPVRQSFESDFQIGILGNSTLAESSSRKSVLSVTAGSSFRTRSSSPEIVDASSDEEPATTLEQTKKNNVEIVDASSDENSLTTLEQTKKNDVDHRTYRAQVDMVKELETEAAKAENTLRVININLLPDKGAAVIQRSNNLKDLLQKARDVLTKMNPTGPAPPPVSASKLAHVAWSDIQAGMKDVQPRTLGEKGLARYQAEKAMTGECLEQLHSSLQTCPTEKDLATDPKGLKVDLLPHQKRALTWLMWREKQKPSGGILADDMGLGKTLTMISLTLKSLENERLTDEDDDDDDEEDDRRCKYSGGTLVVSPASVLNQWSSEITRRTKRGLVSAELYHGPKRESKAKKLAKHDVVLTTYAIVMNECSKNSTLFQVKWRRVILDEAHQIRNHKSQTSEAACKLAAKSRWALTGTPVHNKELDMYALLKFLRCSPFDNLPVWKHWVSDKSTGGQERLHTVISSLMLRRTKAELIEKGQLSGMPDRKWELIPVELDPAETAVYQRVLIFSRTLFAQFLHQRAERVEDARSLTAHRPEMANQEYFKMRDQLLKLNRVKEVSQHEILVLLLRLRQICCHPSLISGMLQGDEDLGEADETEDSEEINLLEQLQKLDLDGEDRYQGHQNVAEGCREDGVVSLREASKGYLNASNPVFSSSHKSSKIKTLLATLRTVVKSGDKAVVVSQWTSLLTLIAVHLKHEMLIFKRLDGTIPVNKRQPIVDDFNDPSSDTRVLLLSLTAGGVGLNLVGGNHLFLLDLHWNPQLENQAQDRIYRFGQQKPVYIYKLIAANTIEQRIKSLQENKLAIAEAMLSGSKQQISNKLSLQDLKMLFEFK